MLAFRYTLAFFLSLGLWSLAAYAAPASLSEQPALQSRDTSYWVSSITRNGAPAFNADPNYKIFRNVLDYGAIGDGVADDTEAINRAISEGNRCGLGCDSSTTTPAIVYFPPGTYRVLRPIIQYYYTQIIGDVSDLPTLKADPTFEGMAVIDADPYESDGSNWYTNQNNFFRQIRNIKIDLTAMPPSRGACIHWQVAQATSLQNIEFNMVQGGDDNHQLGIFMDNGSGGFMTDLTFNGGEYGAFLGSQQFTSRNLVFNSCKTAIFVNWNWVWTFQDIKVNNCGVGIDTSNGGPLGSSVGSALVLDSSFVGTPIGIRTAYRPTSLMTNGTMVIENCDFSGTEMAVQFFDPINQVSELIVPGGQTIEFYSQGREYTGIQTAEAKQAIGTTVARPQALLAADGKKLFTRSRPQYETFPAAQFVSVKNNAFANAVGDGVADDTAAIQTIFNSVTADQVVYFDHGAYIITDTVVVPNNIKITGEMWPLIMAGGNVNFADVNNPKPVFKVGTRDQTGEAGSVEMSDLIFETKGPQPGAILMEWNLNQATQGSNALWDVHFRVGGSAGTELQSDKCSKNPTAETTEQMMIDCAGSFMHLHITETGSVYLENVWSWTSDHELDLTDFNQINIFNGRGILVESREGPVWMWGTASEHNVLFNYQVSNARNVFMGCIQTETPYYQGNPNSLVPFPIQAKFFDPDFAASCAGSTTGQCHRSWGLRVTDSQDVFLYGGGLYSFFDNYSQVCLDVQSCQENMVSIENSVFHTYAMSTKASFNMLTANGQSVALDSENRSGFCATISAFHSLAQY